MYQLLLFCLQPSFLLFVLVGLAIANLWRKRQESRGRLLWVTVPFVVLTILCIPAVGYLAQGILEWPYAPLNEAPEDAEAIVVLSGMILPPDQVRAKAELGPDTLHRCLLAYQLHQKAKHLPVLVTGGLADDSSRKPPLAEVMRDFLIEQGMRPSELIVENQAKNTYENAVESAKLLRERNIRRIILVTDADHMYRAVLCFRKQGIEVIPAPCNYTATRLDKKPENYLPSPKGAWRFERAFHEYLGLAHYWLQGRI